jgi:hypothetical protein
MIKMKTRDPSQHRIPRYKHEARPSPNVHIDGADTHSSTRQIQYGRYLAMSSIRGDAGVGSRLCSADCLLCQPQTLFAVDRCVSFVTRVQGSSEFDVREEIAGEKERAGSPSRAQPPQ